MHYTLAPRTNRRKFRLLRKRFKVCLLAALQNVAVPPIPMQRNGSYIILFTAQLLCCCAMFCADVEVVSYEYVCDDIS